MTVLQATPLNIYTLRTLRSDESAGYIALCTHLRQLRARQTETISAAPESGWTVTISSCQIRWTTFQIDTRVRPVRLCSRALHQSACVHSNICATFAGTVVDHVRVTTRGNGSSAPRPRRLTFEAEGIRKRLLFFLRCREATALMRAPIKQNNNGSRARPNPRH